MFKIPAPYIIIGMHRSGTSLVANVLHEAGINMGKEQDHNNESLPFLSCNQRTLWEAGANWIEPKVPASEFWRSMNAKEMYFEHHKAYGRKNQWPLLVQSKPWGWKDPRNTFTLNMWLSLYPNAKVIHVKRNADDVALSLQNRNKVIGEVRDERLDNLEFNKSLWKKYNDQAKSYKTLLGARYFEISYEEIISKDAGAIQQLERFCAKQLMRIISSQINSHR